MTPGEAVYRKWAEMAEIPPVLPSTTWDALPEHSKAGWEQIALEAVRNYRCQCECHEECGE